MGEFEDLSFRFLLKTYVSLIPVSLIPAVHPLPQMLCPLKAKAL